MRRMLRTILLILFFFFAKSCLTFECREFIEDQLLKCNLQTLQTGFEARRFDETKNVVLRCADEFMFESQLPHFGELPKLEKLSIESCKIRNIPARAFSGLENLKSLKIESHSSVLMDVDVDSLKRNSRLAELAMPKNNIWSLPSGLLCDLHNLRLLNLSHNHLMEIADIGLSSCRISVVVLDVSNNFISALADGDLNWMPTIEKLDISHNSMNQISENSFEGVLNLREINLSYNQLSSLPSNLFNNSLGLEKVELQNNAIGIVNQSLFYGLTDLRFLNLSHNDISTHHISKETFSSLASLIVLDLSFNRLTKLPDDVFASLTSLTTLHLQNNNIHKIDGNAFANQVQLKGVDLSQNKLTSLSTSAFASLGNLVTLRMVENELQDLSNLTFKCQNLLELTLKSNFISSVPNFVKNCSNVRTIDLSENKITSLHNDTFSGLANLVDLDLSGNQLVQIKNNSFGFSNVSSSSSLSSLNLSNNRLASIDQLAFDGLKNLRLLSLNDNFVDDLNGIFSHLAALEWLNVSSNKVDWFDYAFLPPSLTSLDLSNNLITDLSNFYGLENFRLQVLDASNNLVARIAPNSFLLSLVHIRLEKNQISEIVPNSFSHLDNLQSVDLRYNGVHRLAAESLITSYKNVHGRPRFFFYGNPLSCDCYLDWLPSINEQSQRQSLAAMIVDLEDLRCVNHLGAKVTKLHKDQFLCPYETHCFDLCMCCDFYACDCRMQCPYGCECEHDLSWSMNVVKCSNKNHTHIPALIPMDSRCIHLDGNRFHYIDQQNFVGRQRVQKLYLNSSGVARLGEAPFAGLTDLRILHLEDNKLGELRGDEFIGLGRLKELNLQHNALTSIGATTFDHLISLQILRLDGNLLSNFQVWKLTSTNHLLSSISLSENLWSCGCDFISPFNDFLERKRDIISDYDNVICVSSREGLKQNEPCTAKKSKPVSKQVGRIDQEDEDNNEALELATILVPSTLAIILIFIAFLAVCVFRKSINSWIYGKSSDINEGNNSRPNTIYNNSNNSINLTSSEPECNSGMKILDAYVSYSLHDSDLVHRSLAQILETGSNQIFFHHRDFPVGSAFSESTTCLVAESAEKILIVLSESYIHTQLQTLRSILLNDKEQNKDKILFVMIENLGNQLLFRHPDLCRWLSACPIVRWGSPGFINNLRFFLSPASMMTFRRSITLRPDFRVTTLKRPLQAPCAVDDNAQSMHFPGNGTFQIIEPPASLNLAENRISEKVGAKKNLCLVLRAESSVQPSRSSRQLPAVCHSYSQSTSSGQQLLAATADAEEYLV